MKKKVILDFDGVIHSYTSPWRSAKVAPDLPVPGAIEYLRHYLKDFTVSIWSARSSEEGGIECMQNYLIQHGMTPDEVKQIKWPTDKKPQCHLFIDDRVMRFTGSWPCAEAIKGFKQWNK